jgi:predicted negative regulator of RcsB-dependent stress response
MAAYDLEEQEQLDQLKTWWKMYGNLVTALVTAAALVALGWQGWNWWQRSQSAQASGLYGALQQAAAQKDAKRVRELAGELIDKYSGTSYAGLGALISAKAQVDGGDVKTAQAQLTWASQHAGDEAVRDLARLRLAAVLLDEKSYDQAAKLLSPDPAPAFQPRFSELRGDILAAQGKLAEARAAYQAALEKLAAASKETSEAEGARRGPYRDMLQLKLDALGEAK